MEKTDQVTLSILVNNLYWIAEEMNVYLTKAAFSTNIKVRRDCSCALYTRNGEMIAQGEFVPVHLGIMAQTLKAVLEEYPLETWHEGDVMIHNDPYKMGSHLWDIMLFRPVFYQGELIAFVGSLAHHVDVGGAAIQSCLETVFEEGLRLPPVKIYEKGVRQETVFKIIKNNVRTPYEIEGDLAAQYAANYRGVQRICELAEKYGAQTLMAYFEEILNYSERGMRETIKAIPDTEAEFVDYVEHDGIEEGKFEIRAKVMIRGDQLFVDFDGSCGPGRGGVNAPWSLTHSAVYYAVKSVLGSNIPTNAGAYRPIHLIRPKQESMVDVKFPHAVGSCTCSPSQRIADVVIGALAAIVPERACACDGHWPSGKFVGLDPRTGRYSAYLETYGCGRGAKYNDDGADGHQTHMTNTSNAPIEIIELEHPLKVLKYGLLPDSCGAGEYRGGVGITRELLATTDMVVTALGNRPHIQPYGLNGGKGGSTDYCMIEMQDGTVTSSSSSVKKGDRIVIRSSGGGGWGDPLKRDPARVAMDVLDGYISREKAQEEYGVVVKAESSEVDLEKTAALRESIRQKRQK